MLVISQVEISQLCASPTKQYMFSYCSDLIKLRPEHTEKVIQRGLRVSVILHRGSMKLWVQFVFQSVSDVFLNDIYVYHGGNTEVGTPKCNSQFFRSSLSIFFITGCSQLLEDHFKIKICQDTCFIAFFMNSILNCSGFFLFKCYSRQCLIKNQ